jgi:hypothetical protein
MHGSTKHFRTAAPTADLGRSDPIELVLARLTHVKRRERGGWMASCPTADHERGDRHPSLAVDVGDNGGVVFKCFSHQCSVESIAAALGLTVGDLFPRVHGRDFDPTAPKPKLPKVTAGDLIALAAFEARVASIGCADILAGKTLEPSDLARLALAVETLAAIHQEVAYGNR